MLQGTRSRGFISNDDNGANVSYYLYIESWYRTLSSNSMWSDGHIYVINVYSEGYVGGNTVNSTSSGLQSFFFKFNE